jgi:hypothetical protein
MDSESKSKLKRTFNIWAYLSVCDMLSTSGVEALLSRLWSALQPCRSVPSHPVGCPGPRHAGWRTIGFQADTPLTDVRSAGLLGLQLLVEVAERSSDAAALAHASVSQFPYCAAVLDCAFMLFAALKLMQQTPSFCPAMGTQIRQPDRATRNDLRGFLGLVLTEASPLDALRG